ncbi:YsnF/AvaK domain-containing protein (plasmid) [Deinococcus taeanensis]|uniref:DUF2382 domain-containing protein n=1 Tax=Deinococcus taeanensis TaxID=2737050 RepID=UPI001CDC3D7A|nr:DUF2382 domain-containing protein [Deinococcus taeanensis]UBV45055.1 YsnF/AvaK domain-containing protein [Deinococcus taeanensis]
MDDPTEQQLLPERRESVGILELREERAVVQTIRELTGTVQVRRERRVSQETVTVNLEREVLVITAAPGDVRVEVNGEALEPAQEYELLVYEERAQISVVPYVSERVEVFKQTRTEVVSQEITLAREVLVVDQKEGDALAQTPVTPEQVAGQSQETRPNGTRGPDRE